MVSSVVCVFGGNVVGAPSITASSGRSVDQRLLDVDDRLAITAELGDLRGDPRNRLRMIELQAAGASPSRDLTGGEDDELVDFAWSQVHGQTAPG
jgi:hypothetical protein